MKESLLNLIFAQAACPALDHANEFLIAHAGEVLLGVAAFALLVLLIFHRWAWREMSSLRTAQIFMIVLGCLVGAALILPQDANYDGLAAIAKWGWVTNLTKGLRLMNVYTAAPFYVLLALLMLSALICFLHNLRALFRRPAPAAGELVGKPEAVTLKLACPFNAEGLAKMYKALRDRGLRVPKMGAEPPPAAVIETGSGTLWPALLFHLGIMLWALSCLLTWLFGFSGYVTVYTDHPEAIPLTSRDIQWRALRSSVCEQWDQLFGEKKKEAPKLRRKPASQRVLWLGLKKLRAVYDQRPILNYPLFSGETPYGYRAGFFGDRFNWAWVSGKAGLKSYVSDTAYGPTDFSAHVITYLDEDESDDHDITPGRSILTEGLYLSLVGCAFKVDMEVENAPPLKGLVPGQAFRFPGAVSQHYVQNVTAGIRITMDGKASVGTPTVALGLLPSPLPGAQAAATPSPIVLPLNQPRQIGERKVQVANVIAGGVIRYRHDPGALLWTPAAILILFAIGVRVYWSHYRVKLTAEDAGDGATLLHVAAVSHGVFADPKRAIFTAKKALQAAGLLSTPHP